MLVLASFFEETIDSMDFLFKLVHPIGKILFHVNTLPEAFFEKLNGLQSRYVFPTLQII
jgi:hypothetical protein